LRNNELKAIADDICAAANGEFPRQKKYTGQKWTLRDGEKVLESIELVDVSILLMISSLKKHAAYLKLKEHIENLSSVQAVTSIAGYHTQPEQLVTQLIKGAFLPSEQRFDPEQLLERLNELITLISSESHEFIIIGRLHGVKLETDFIELEPNILLVRLDDDAINERQPLLSEACDSPRILDYSNSNIEIKIITSYPITPLSELSYFNVSNKAVPELRQKLGEVVRSIKLYRSGTYEVYPATHHCPLSIGGASFPIEPKYISPFNSVVLDDADTDGLKKAFSIVKTVISQDSVLQRSFSRFLIGQDERVPEERVVDFVIAWESLLLTVNGNSINSEVSYRFSLNGAAILVVADNTLEFTEALKLMKGTYGIRSTIVHGGNTDSLRKDINKLGFDNVDALNSRLSELYRKVVYWLATLEKEERPYYVPSGWELLIRKNAL
jgi:hypothetical protein